MAVDPYSPNPFADLIRETDPYRYEKVAAVVAPPKMFAGGRSDTPAFTASGIDPELLLRLPPGVRHAAAAEPNITVVHRWFEEYAGFPEIVVDHPGWTEARRRVEDWITNTDLDTRSEETKQAELDAEYAAMFPVDRDRTAYLAEQKRRKQLGLDPLEDFATLDKRRREREQWAANSGGGAA